MAKKKRRPNIDPKVLTRPRLDAIFAQYKRGEIEVDELIARVLDLMAQAGRAPVIDALVKRIQSADSDEQVMLMAVLSDLGDEQAVDCLWGLLEQPQMSVSVKSAVLTILQQLGEDVGPDDLGDYISLKDVRAGDATQLEELGRASVQVMARTVSRAESVDEVEALMFQFEDMSSEDEGQEIRLFMVESVAQLASEEAADMLLAWAYTTSKQRVRQAIRKALDELAERQIYPQSAVIKSLGQEVFYAAYCSDPANPWQQQVTMAWERPGNAVQAMVFLLDFGPPWSGSLKDMFVTHSLSKSQFKRQLVNESTAHGIEQRRIPFARARRLVLEAIQANKRNRMRLPSEYYQFRHLIERRIENPSPEALAQAEALDAQTEDEWGELEEPVVRGVEIMEDGTPLVIFDAADWDHMDWDDDDDE